MMIVDRQLPRNNRIISADQRGGQHASRMHAEHRGFDEHRLVAHAHGRSGSPAGSPATRGNSDLTPSMTFKRRRGAGLEDRHQHRARSR